MDNSGPVNIGFVTYTVDLITFFADEVPAKFILLKFAASPNFAAASAKVTVDSVNFSCKGLELASEINPFTFNATLLKKISPVVSAALNNIDFAALISIGISLKVNVFVSAIVKA